MNTIKTTFAGINRSVDTGISQDGQSMELINARLKNGSIEPIGKPVLIKSFDFNVDKVYYHTLAKKVIIFANNGNIYCSDEDYSSMQQLSTDINNATKVEFMGYLACFMMSDKIIYLLFDDNQYRLLGNMPELPNMSVSLDPKVFTTTHLHPYNEDSTLDETVAGYYDKCISNMNDQGYFHGSNLVFRYAIRLSSGDYICHSSPMLICDESGLEYTGWETSRPSGGGQGMSIVLNANDCVGITRSYEDVAGGMRKRLVGALGYLPTITLSNVDLAQWKNIVVGIDIFICVVNPIKAQTKSNRSTGKMYDYYSVKSSDVIEKEISESYKFYKVYEYDINGNKTHAIEDVSIDGLSIQEMLSDDSNTHNTYLGKYSYVYNSMLHIGNISEKLFKGYKYWNFKDTNTTVQASIYTYIQNEQGESIVKSTSQLPYPTMPAFIGYPSYNASKMVIVYERNNATYRKEFKLNRHKYLNYSYFIEKRTTSNNGIKLIHSIDLSKFDVGIDNIVEVNSSLARPNVLKVSALNNPINYPPNRTYQPSSSEIVGMCANTTALSQGQFGQHPLYVFSKDGIFAMSVGTNGIAYSTQTPVTRDVCINSKSIIGIDNAVVFASERGLMVIQGSSSTLLSGDIEGYLPSCINDTLINKVINVGGFLTNISSVIFRDYIAGANIGYNYQENELIVSNNNYNYSYIYNINSGTWGKIESKIDMFPNQYSVCTALIGNSLYNMQNNHRSISKILVLTRPIKFGSNTHKRIVQTALRGVVRPALSDMYLRGEAVQFRGETLDVFSNIGMYILGSNDGEKWELASGREMMSDIRDLITKMNKSKAYKYFSVAFVGGVRTDVSINYIEFTVDEAFANRLR